jgi:glycosyltransferase involved in cell wall biosynthesis
MEGYSWGGSEELWHRVANFAIDNQQKVTICVKYWERRHVKIDELERREAKIIERKINKKSSLFFRGINKALSFFGAYSIKSNEWSWIECENSKHIIISLGGPHDFLQHPGLIKILNKESLSYSVIQQFNFENIIYNASERKLVDQFYSKSDHAYFVSKRNLEVTERSICKKLENACVISNPANLSELELIPFPQQMDVINFACVARLDCMFKAQDILLSVLGNEKWLNRNWKLNFYGEGKDFEYLIELVNFYGLNSRVNFHGHVSDVENIWKYNHILILPSLAEGTPLALIEAMVCGRPGIVSDVGGNAELIRDDINGFVFPVSNLMQCDLGMERAWQQRELWKLLGIEARKQVFEKINFESYKCIYFNSLISKNQPVVDEGLCLF